MIRNLFLAAWALLINPGIVSLRFTFLRVIQWGIAVPIVASTALADDRIAFNRDIRPILSDQCFHCHGPDKNTRKADLRLDLREAAVSQGAIVPGFPDKSRLIERITVEDDELRMPPQGSHKSLTTSQKELLRRWIAEGAEFQAHWAYLPPVQVAPQIELAPERAIRNAIDTFVFAQLQRNGLRPSQEATKEALIRRVTLDLIGLPPTPDEVDLFLSDETSFAFEKVVDRLLKSPHFGERMAIDWLDAARYADSNGYQVDRDRELWPWRDWVIQAFNANMPFDRFTMEQLAGDLLPNATLDQKIATGFHRNHMLNEEGGIIPEEFLAEYTADRVETTAAVWLGQTFQCARCHDHKYDPFTQRDFYGLKAFFHNVPESGLGQYGKPIRRNAPPFIPLPAPELEAKLHSLRSQLADASEERDHILALLESDALESRKRLSITPIEWMPLKEISKGTEGNEESAEGPVIHIEELSAKNESRSFQILLPKGRVSAIRLRVRSLIQAGELQWKEWSLKRNGDSVRLLPIVEGDSLHEDDTRKLIDDDRKTSVALKVEPNKEMVVAFQLSSPSETEDLAKWELSWMMTSTVATQWEVMGTSADPESILPTAIASIVSKGDDELSSEDYKAWLAFRSERNLRFRTLSGEIEQLKKKIESTEEQIPTTLVMSEMEEGRTTYVLMRGVYDKPGEAVTATTPSSLLPFDDTLPRNRLGLAKWLVDPRNPLTARVTVNRFWQQCFGNGIVRTSEDFGSQGEPPSHPELLDWLAIHFMESGWDVKQLMRLIVTSATYRQSAVVDPKTYELDPENRLLSRGPRHRLLGELIRDQALAISGQLVSRIGGPSVKPFHPKGLYEQITAGKGNNVYVQGEGDDLYRRSLYTYWKRSVPHPAMLLFDAPFRESCTLRRPRSNTPLQALNLMNDPTYVEASREVARRMMIEGGDTIDSQLAYGFRLCLARYPNERELKVLRSGFDRSLRDFLKDEEGTKALLDRSSHAVGQSFSNPEHAAMTIIASTLMNLDEVVNK